MSTRKRRTISNPSTVPKSDLPSREGKATAQHKTTLPLSRTPFNKFIYIMSALAFAFFAFQVWRIMELKSAAGGWWNFALGVRSQSAGGSSGHGRGDRKAETGERESVEDRINALAQALGLPSHDLASAIAEAVRSYLPPASLSSLAATEATEKGTAAGILTRQEETQQSGTRMMDKLDVAAGIDDSVDID